jgi:hypothetical protein
LTSRFISSPTNNIDKQVDLGGIEKRRTRYEESVSNEETDIDNYKRSEVSDFFGGLTFHLQLSIS